MTHAPVDEYTRLRPQMRTALCDTRTRNCQEAAMEPATSDKAFLDYAVVQIWNPGDMIHIWTPDTGIYYILRGTVHIVRLFENGSRSILHILDHDNFFFENRYFNHGTRTTSAYAATSVKTAYLSPENVEFLLSTSLGFCHTLIRTMSRKNFSLGKAIADNSHTCATMRMLTVLYELSCEQDGSHSSIIRITQATLADFIGKHPVNTNIILKRLEQAGFIRLKRGSIELNLESIENALRHQES